MSFGLDVARQLVAREKVSLTCPIAELPTLEHCQIWLRTREIYGMLLVMYVFLGFFLALFAPTWMTIVLLTLTAWHLRKWLVANSALRSMRRLHSRLHVLRSVPDCRAAS